MPDHEDQDVEQRNVTMLRQLSILYFLDEDGDPCVTVDFGEEDGGKVSMIELLGLLDVARGQILHNHYGGVE